MLAPAQFSASLRGLRRAAWSPPGAVGNQKHYQANPDSPITAELCGTARKTVGLAEPLRAALLPLVPRIRAAFVFGAVGKRTDTSSSDIDLMVVGDGLSCADLFPVLEPLGAQLGRVVNPTILSSSELRHHRPETLEPLQRAARRRHGLRRLRRAVPADRGGSGGRRDRHHTCLTRLPTYLRPPTRTINTPAATSNAMPASAMAFGMSPHTAQPISSAYSRLV